jgi:hypothetical protein
MSRGVQVFGWSCYVTVSLHARAELHKVRRGERSNGSGTDRAVNIVFQHSRDDARCACIVTTKKKAALSFRTAPDGQ